MSELPEGRWWIALVTFERDGEDQDILPEWAWGACSWMFASGKNEDEAYAALKRDIEFHGLKLAEAEQFTEIFGPEDVDEIDHHLAANLRNFEEGHRTAWGTIDCFKGEGEA